jgi:hypothetical protein
MATKTLDELRMAFMGISTLRYSSTSAKLATDTSWDYILPIGKDTVNFAEGDTSRNQYFIEGESKSYATANAAPAATVLTFFVPSVDADVQALFGAAGSGTPATMTDAILDGTYWKPIGTGLKLETKTLGGMAMIISQDKKYAVVIKNLVGGATLQYDAPNTKPIGYNLSFDVSGITSGDTDGDIVFYEASSTS